MSLPNPTVLYTLSNATMLYLLPSGYLPLAYIESTGTLYIDTGIKFENGTSIYDFNCRVGASLKDGTASSFFGTANYLTGMMAIYHYTNNTYYAVYVKGDNSLGPRAITISKGSIIDYSLSMNLNTRDLLVKFGHCALLTGKFNAMTDYSSNIRIFLSLLYSGGYWKCYYFNITKDNNLILNLLPAQRISDGVIGMYDTVSNTFFTNAGTGAFIAGPELAIGKSGGYSLPIEYLLVEYLESTGTQYIDTGVKFTNGGSISAKLSILGTVNDNAFVLGSYVSGNRYAIRAYNGSRGLWIQYGSGNAVLITSGGFNVYYDVYMGPSSCIINGTTYNHSLTASDNNANIYLFSTGGTRYYSKSKIYSCKIMSSSTETVRNMYPCYRKSDMKPGMYDAVNKTFYTNSGSGEFILGPTISGYYSYEPNAAGKNLYPYDTTRTITTPTTLDRKSNLYFNGIPGPWTISFDGESTASVTVTTDICDAGSKNMSFSTTKLHYYITATASNYYTNSSYNGFWDFTGSSSPSSTITLSNIMMVLSDHEMPFVPKNSEGAYYNVSGYYDTTLNKWIADFTDSGYLTSTFPSLGNNYTISWIEYSSNFNASTMPFAIGSFNPLFSKCLNTGDGGNNPWYKPGTTTKIDDITNSVWHHFAVVGNGTDVKLYVDGNHYGTAKTFKDCSGTTFRINGWSSGAYKRNGKLYNFQAWNTALTAALIKELYGK